MDDKLGGIFLEWIEVFIETSQTGLEIVAGMLYQCGLTGLQIEDGNEFAEFLENPNRQWDYIEDELVEEKRKQPTGITFYVRDNLHGREQLAQIRSALHGLQQGEQEFDLGSLTVRLNNRKEEDWVNEWKKYFKPFPIGDKIMIKPSWEELAPQEGKIILKIDPGHIFGTGSHETTQLCIEAIETYVKEGDKVLDIGCGSGILSIASLLLGAAKADAIDIDPNAVEVAYENSDRNAIDRSRYEVISGNILEDAALGKRYIGQQYDVVEANIVADVIIALTNLVPQYIREQGIFLTSGIIAQREEDVKKALEETGFTILKVKRKKDWVAMISRYH